MTSNERKEMWHVVVQAITLALALVAAILAFQARNAARKIDDGLKGTYILRPCTYPEEK